VHNLYTHECQSRNSERWLIRRLVALASSLITHSDTARRIVANEFHVQDRQKIAVVPHGNYIGCYQNTLSSEEARRRLQLDPQSTVFLFFGNIRPYKGVSQLIESFEEMKCSSCSLVIAGRPLNQAVASTIEKRIAGNGLIQLRAGYIPDEEVECYMNAADVVVFPYQDVLTSGAVILAMSFGRACIAPAMGCISDVLDERGAFLYDPGASDGLREAMKQAVRARARLNEMGEHNRKRAEEWGWDRIARATARVYADALGQSTTAEHLSFRHD
jgi:glycosyltransferase involved in cell wall biosynthesis